jgi:hypothetical protein
LLERSEAGELGSSEALRHIARVKELSRSLRSEWLEGDDATSFVDACRHLIAATRTPDERREHADTLMDLAELVQIARKQFGVGTEHPLE